MSVAAAQVAGRLGGGGAVDIPLGRVVLAFLLCALIAFLAILLIRQRLGRGDVADWFRRIRPTGGTVEIVEVCRLTIHADIGVVRHDGREYLLLLQAGANRVLREGAAPPPIGTPR